MTLLPGPRDLHAPQLLTEAQRLMASGGFLAVAWNDRWVACAGAGVRVCGVASSRVLGVSRLDVKPQQTVILADVLAYCCCCLRCCPTPRPLPSVCVCVHPLPFPVLHHHHQHTRRDLSSPFVSDLESLLEHINPHYCRSSRQHSPPAVASALSGGGALSLHSYAAWAHSLSMAKAGVLQDLLGGFEVVRPYLAASSTHRKAFHQVRGWVWVCVERGTISKGRQRERPRQSSQNPSLRCVQHSAGRLDLGLQSMLMAPNVGA